MRDDLKNEIHLNHVKRKADPVVPIKSSAAPNNTNPTRLSPEREAEIRERLASTLAFRKSDAEALLAELDRLRAELVDQQEDLAFLHRSTLPELRRESQHHEDGKKRWRDRAEKAEAALAAKPSQPDVIEHGIRMPNGDVTLKRHSFPHDWDRMIKRGGVHVSRTIRHGEWTEVAS